ncbi:MAG: aspartyl protease family protein [Phycisphaerae bacterium]|nr:aspartyl protease family protein [Phycisphaerae bacterium]
MPSPLRDLVATLVVIVAQRPLWALPPQRTDDLPVLRTNSRSIDVQDGPRLHKGGWVVLPEVALDVYEADRTLGPKTITLISDIDRLSFEVTPGQHYDFVILLDGTTRCPTRISTLRQAPIRLSASAGPDVIPFSLDRGRIMVQARINGSKPIDLLVDTGANATLLAPSAIDRGVTVKASGTAQNFGLGGSVEIETSANNTVDVAGLRWEHEPLLLHDRPSTAGDGVLGMHMFDGKVVEFDYDRSVLVVHDALPESLDGFVRVELGRAGPLPTIPVTFHTGVSTVTGSVIIDTGATAALFARRDFAEPLGLYGTMPKIGTGRQTGIGRGSLESDLVLLPTMTIDGIDMKDVPIYLETADHETSEGEGAVLGMDVLRRFTMVLDTTNDVAYLKPNASIGDPFERRSGGVPVAVVVGTGVVVLGLLSAVFLWRRRASASR